MVGVREGSSLAAAPLDCKRPLSPCATDTIIIFPTTTSHPAFGSGSVNNLPQKAQRIVIHLPYNSQRLRSEQPSDCFFCYELLPILPPWFTEPQSLSTQLCQKVVVVLPTTPEGIMVGSHGGIPQSVTSMQLAVYVNPALRVTVLAEHWDWGWFFAKEDSEYTQTLSLEEAEQWAFAWKVYWNRTLDSRITLTEEVLGRITFMTSAEYEDHVCPRLFQLMQQQ